MRDGYAYTLNGVATANLEVTIFEDGEVLVKQVYTSLLSLTNTS